MPLLSHLSVPTRFMQIFAASALMVGGASMAQAVTVGAGTGIPLESLDTAGNQPRLNVDNGFTVTLQPGTYSVESFSFAAGQAGDVTPFIAIGSGVDTYRALAVGEQVSIGGPTTQTVAFGGSKFFSITTNNTVVFAGISNPPGSANPIFLDNGVGSTDHDSSFNHVTTGQIGDSFGGFSNANLGRTYAFSMDIQTTSLPRAGAGIGIAHDELDGAGGARMNIDKNFSLTLDAGTYSADSFEFSTGRAGEVTPFLAILNGDRYEIIALGDTVVVADGNQDQLLDFGGDRIFQLDATTTIFAGFTSGPDGNPIFLDNGTTTQTDHDGSPVTLTGVGQELLLSDISNTNLGRTYAFAISVVAVPEPATVTLGLLTVGGLMLRRRRMA